jgi:hypothetical protein
MFDVICACSQLELLQCACAVYAVSVSVSTVYRCYNLLVSLVVHVYSSGACSLLECV